MTGEHANSTCPTCGGRLHTGVATIPFLLSETQVIVIKGVPAETCGDCHEPFLSSKVTDDVMALLQQLKTLGSEVSVVSFPDYAVTSG